jgi:1-aminocyclopropane-1-carboxylate deaminase/D-cysteine desulfhydrase-like pyridoxal-dependent ACC family enzyme
LVKIIVKIKRAAEILWLFFYGGEHMNVMQKKIVTMKYLIFCCMAWSSYANELLFLDNLKTTLSFDDETYDALISKATHRTPLHFTNNNDELPLFIVYPLLMEHIPYISLGSFPTPIQRLSILEEMYGIENFFIKQDAVSGGIDTDGMQLFGGNKVRKLEFLLADALRYNAETVLTFGGIGSNHAVATATYAQQCGLRCYCMLTPQSDSPVVQRNLSLMKDTQTEIIFSGNAIERKENTIKAFSDNKKNYGDYPYFIPTGGSVALGAVGFVNAAFELADQIKAGYLPEPDYIYVAAGSFGTTAGLSLGLKAAGIRSQIIAVAIEPEKVSGSVVNSINVLFKKTNELLHGYDETFPLFESADNVTVTHGFGGTCYGLCTPEAMDAIDTIQKQENIILDGTYTGKAFAALIDHAGTGMFKDKSILFWNTFCSDGL